MTPQQLGGAIRRARRARRMSQAELAEAIDASCSQGQVSDWETGRGKPEEETIERIVQALEMSEEEFAAYLDPFTEVP